MTTITFADGTTHAADVVVGCDGIRSVVRSSVAGKDTDPKFTRTVAFRALISEEDGLAAFGDTILRKLVCLIGPDSASSTIQSRLLLLGK